MYNAIPALDPSQRLSEARGLCFDAGGRRLIRDLSLTIRRGRRTMIMGANGAGKSLTLRLLHGLIQPIAGEILWQGAPLDRAARHAQAMVFQRPVLLRRSVLANLRFALSARGVRRAERAARAEQALDLARLTDMAHRPARTLSGGEQQRLALARALTCRPRLLLLDEPTASLDPASTLAIEELIREAHAHGVTIVMVTHDSGQARRLGQDLAFMHAGQVVETGPLAMTFDAPRSEPLRAWLDGRIYIDTHTTKQTYGEP